MVKGCRNLILVPHIRRLHNADTRLTRSTLQILLFLVRTSLQQQCTRSYISIHTRPHTAVSSDVANRRYRAADQHSLRCAVDKLESEVNADANLNASTDALT